MNPFDVLEQKDVNTERLIAALSQNPGFDINSRNKDNETLAHIAARLNLPDILIFLAKKVANFNIKNSHGETPLFVSIKAGAEKAFATMLDLGRDEDDAKDEGIDIGINEDNLLGQGVLHYAIIYMRHKFLTKLFESFNEGYFYECPYDTYDKSNKLAVFYAIDAGDADMLDVCISNDFYGVNALKYAYKQQKILFLQKIKDKQLEKRFNQVDIDTLDYDDYMYDVLIPVIEDVNIEEGMFRALFRKFMNNMRDDIGMTLLHHAAVAGNAKAVSYMASFGNLQTDLISEDDSVIQGGATASHYAAYNGYKDIVDILVEYDKGVTLNKFDDPGLTPLQEAVSQKREGVVSLLLSKYRRLIAVNIAADNETSLTIDIDSKTVTINPGVTALDIAKEVKDAKCYEMLRASGAKHASEPLDLNAEILRAAELGHIGDLQDLKNKGASLTVSDQNGKTPLLLAAEKGFLDIVIYITRQASEYFRQEDTNKQNALILSACNDRVEVMEFLIQRKHISLETLDVNNRTALYWAARSNCVRAVKLLLKSGAKISADIMHDAHHDVKAIFNYRPGRKQRSIFDLCKEGEQLPSEIELLLLDYEDTTDDSSSDDDEIMQCHAMLERRSKASSAVINQALTAKHKAKIAAFNAAKKDKKEVDSESKELKYILHRGVHFDPKYYTKQGRRQAYRTILTNPDHKEATLSYAMRQLTAVESKNKGADIKTDAEIAQSDAHKEVKNYLSTLRTTPNSSKKTYEDKRETEFARLVQDYVHDYNTVINLGGIKSNFGFNYTFNPLISASYLSQRAYIYASGMLFGKEHRLNPHYRRSTLKPKHPCLGIVYSYAIDCEYAFKNSVNVLDYNHQKKIGIKNRFQFECEVIFESFIPESYMQTCSLLVLPDLSVPKDESPERFQYGSPKHQGAHTRHRNHFKKLKEPLQSDSGLYNKSSGVNKVIEHVVEKDHVILDAEVTKVIYSAGHYPCYPFKDETLSLRPIKPPLKGKWGDISQDEALKIAEEKKEAKDESVTKGLTADFDAVMETESTVNPLNTRTSLLGVFGAGAIHDKKAKGAVDTKDPDSPGLGLG